MQKLYSVQAARGIAALMVVAFHSLSIQSKYTGDALLPSFLTYGQAGVDLFFVISGFVMVLATQNSDRSTGTVMRFLKGRFLRIYPTYWVYFIALCGVLFVAPGMINSSQGGEVSLLSSFLLTPSEHLPILLVAWTLTHEVWFYIVFAGLLFAKTQTRIWTLLIWFMVIYVLNLTGPGYSEPVLRVLTHAFTLEFILGALGGYAFIKIQDTAVARQMAACLLMVGMGLLIWAVYLVELEGVDAIQNVPLARAMLAGSGFCALILGISLMELKALFKVPKPLKLLGDISYSIYLSHVLVLSLCGRVWYSVHSHIGNLGNHSYLFWVATWAAAIFGGYIAYVMIERPILNRTLHKRARCQAAEPVAMCSMPKE